MDPISTSKDAHARRQILADSSLVVVTLVWGATFVLVKDIVEQVSPMLFLAVRFALGALALALLVAVTGKWRGLSMRELGWGTILGMLVGVGYTFQTVGLQWTTASNAGFITGLSVVLVSVLGFFILKHRPDTWSWSGVIFATVGLILLSVQLDKGISFNRGDPLVLGCAVAFALQIVFVSKVAASTDPLRMTLVQLIVAGLLNGVGALLFERPVSGLGGEIWAGAAFMGLVATGAAFVVQMTVQRFTTAVHTALIFTLEPVFAAIFGFWLQGDRLTQMGWSGAALILGGMLVAELGPQLRSRRARRRTRSMEALPAAAYVPAIQPRTELPQADVS